MTDEKSPGRRVSDRRCYKLSKKKKATITRVPLRGVGNDSAMSISMIHRLPPDLGAIHSSNATVTSYVELRPNVGRASDTRRRGDGVVGSPPSIPYYLAVEERVEDRR